jgi:hypothetical protein
MSCDCGKCREHYRTLGIGYGIPTESEIQDAYREAIKQWHPDLYENFASLRADAEERFKLIQVAYRELKEHNSIAVESPAEIASGEIVPEKPADTPPISFDGAPGCLVAPHFTPEAEEIIGHYIGKLGAAVAIVDLTGSRSQTRSYAQFFLLADLGIMVRDAHNIVSLLWYKDLGEINLIRRQEPSKPSMWQNLVGGISGSQPKCMLQIYRINGALFYSLADPVEDGVKTAIHDFLQLKKNQSHP